MRKLAVLLTGVLGLTLLVGCGDDRSDKSVANQSSVATAAPSIVAPGLRAQSPAPQDNNSGAQSTATRKEVITGSVDLTTGDPVGAAGRIADQVRDIGGRVDSRTEQPGAGDTDPSATLTVRVPADKTDAFIDGLGGIGSLTRVSTNRDDVTMQWEDLDAKITALQASVDRLRALMATATSTADLIAAEGALSSRQGQLDSLTAQKRRLDDQVALSSLTIDITTETKKSDAGPTNFWDGIVSGWHSMVDWLKDAIVFSGKAIPWLGLVVVIAAVVWGIVRAVRRPGRKNTGSPTQEQSTASKEAAAQEESTPEPANVGVSNGVETGPGTGEAGADSAGDNQTEQP
ncbi:DUF4349 domain-containing protein [Nocardia australiensis]|uniref:DUF4349 domain-containing protein n=1 Tax=Nocardia australiensis TaxID=2887191 RepID=UPI001D148268|nr:DUF4349 domain-containing protein [Nocardia australiensis]